ncbi:MAG: type II secretion system protein GspF, partial [Burkholderiales bacterium]
MPAYSFEALQNDGVLRKGVIEADSAKAARVQLRSQSLVPLAVQALAQSESDKKNIWQTNIGSAKCFSANA